MSDVDGILILRKEHNDRIYQIVKSQYKNVTSNVFKFEKGDRDRCKQAFVRMKEASGLKNEADFEVLLDMFDKYIAKSAQDWIRWDKAEKFNYIGFLNNRDSISIFAKNKAAGVAGISHTNKDYAIAGTGDKSDWK